MALPCATRDVTCSAYKAREREQRVACCRSTYLLTRNTLGTGDLQVCIRVSGAVLSQWNLSSLRFPSHGTSTLYILNRVESSCDAAAAPSVRGERKVRNTRDSRERTAPHVEKVIEGSARRDIYGVPAGRSQCCCAVNCRCTDKLVFNDTKKLAYS